MVQDGSLSIFRSVGCKALLLVNPWHRCWCRFFAHLIWTTHVSLAPRPWQPQSQCRSSENSLWGAWVCHQSPRLIGDGTWWNIKKSEAYWSWTWNRYKPGFRLKPDALSCPTWVRPFHVFSACSIAIFWPHRNVVVVLQTGIFYNGAWEQETIWLRATSSIW